MADFRELWLIMTENYVPYIEAGYGAPARKQRKLRVGAG